MTSRWPAEYVAQYPQIALDEIERLHRTQRALLHTIQQLLDAFGTDVSARRNRLLLSARKTMADAKRGQLLDELGEAATR